MRYVSRKVVLVVALIASAAMPVAAQAPAEKPSLEPVSIKLTKSDGFLSVPPVTMGSRFVATNVTLKDLVFFAYVPQSGAFVYDEIVGGPNWIDADHFDIDAQVKGNRGPMSRDKMQLMAQLLLEDRFQLKLHRETQELPVLNLVVGESGLKMKMSEDQTPPNAHRTYDSSTRNGEGVARGEMRVSTSLSETIFIGNAIPLSRLAGVLQGQLGRMVFDKTNLNELFDLSMRFSRQDLTSSSPANQSGTSLLTAIQELGLKLDPAKGPVEVLVIDHVERPSEN